jgi:CPA2 family monovalent cation:H+ antiporter-2
MSSILYIIIFSAGLSLILNIFLKKIKIESIIGYILTGVIIAFMFNLQHNKSDILDKIAEFGVAFLMFSIGLEFSLSKLKQMKKEVFLNGTLQVVLTSLTFFIITKIILDLPTTTSIILSCSLALSSTAIVLKLLNENQDIYKQYGQNSLGILLFQDIAVIPILLMVSIFANANESISDLLILTTLSALAVIFIMFTVGKFIISKIFELVIDSKSDELFVTLVLLLVISSAEFAHYFGFSYSLGAFLAGMIISESKYKYQVEADLIPFRDVLLGIFFIAVGMQVDLAYIPVNILTILAILISILAIKSFIIFAILKFQFKTKISLQSALILSQVGEFSFAVFELAKINNLFDDSLTQPITISIVISMILTPFIFRKLDKISSIFSKDNSVENILDREQKEHIVVCGYGLLGQRVVKNLKDLNLYVVAIEKNLNLVNKAKDNNDIVIFGDASKKHIIDEVNVSNAKAVIIAIDNEDKILSVVENIKTNYQYLDVFVKVSSRKDELKLQKFGIKYVVNDIEHTSKILINFMMNKESEKLI